MTFARTRPKSGSAWRPGREVRLKHAYYITCEEVVKDENGEVVELRCTYDPETRGGWTPDGRKVRGTLHWVSAAHALDAEVRLYDHLFTLADPDDVGEGEDFTRLPEPRLAGGADRLQGRAQPGRRGAGQPLPVPAPGLFLRRSRFRRRASLVFNRTVTLRDTWARIEKAQ